MEHYSVWGISHAARLKGLTRLKGILANRLPPVIEVIPRSGYDTNLKVLIKKTSKSQHKKEPQKANASANPNIDRIQFYRVIIAMSEIFSIFAT